MKVNIVRKGDSQYFTGVTSVVMTKKGWLFSHVNVEMTFGTNAFTRYTSKEHETSRKINPDEIPVMDIDYCEKVVIFEEYPEAKTA